MPSEPDRPDRGTHTWVTNPAEPAELGPATESRMDKNTNTKPSGKGGGGGRKKNPLAALGPMLPHVIAIAVGGGCGALEATQPAWWAKLGDGARVILFGAGAAVAFKMKQDGPSKACETMAAFY